MRYNLVIRLFALVVITLAVSVAVSAALVNPQDTGIGDMTLDESYDELLDSMYTGGAMTTFDNKLWVPWYSTSSSCEEVDLHKGNACNADTIDGTHNCMVTDEFSQVGVLLSMGKDEQRMKEFYNTLPELKSQYGDLPAWRVYRNGNDIEQCKDGINGNCDTASDADARVIIALFTAANNPHFAEEDRKAYGDFAAKLSADLVKYEVDHECRASSLGQGDICHWLAAGPGAQQGGLASYDYAYTGYYGDVIIAMLQAYKHTGDEQYKEIADHLTLNYLQAAEFDGKTFSTPPGRSFTWTNLNGVPKAQCSGNCNPVQWDFADASRAVSMCQAKYYADEMGEELPLLAEYCDAWDQKHMSDPTRAPIQYYPNGEASSPYQSGYFPQGLQALMLSGVDEGKFAESLRSALTHYSTTTKTWDWTACFGVYTQAFPMRALGTGIGRDLASFTDEQVVVPVPEPTPIDKPVLIDNTPQPTPDTSNTVEYTGVQSLAWSCIADGKKCTLKEDLDLGTCRSVLAETDNGDIKVMACEKGSNVEVYRQAMPTNTEFEACLGSGCMTKWSGWARFTPTDVDVAIEEPVLEQPAPTPVGKPTTPSTPPKPVVTEQEVAMYELPVTCEVNGGCILSSDTTAGTCRTITHNTAKGTTKVMACDKGDRVEVYSQAKLSTQWEVCVHTGCVGSKTGFATTTRMVKTSQPSPVPEPEVITEPVIDPTPVEETPIEVPTVEKTPVEELPPVDTVGVGAIRLDELKVSGQGQKVADYIRGSDGVRRVEYNTKVGWIGADISMANSIIRVKLANPGTAAEICVEGHCVGKDAKELTFTPTAAIETTKQTESITKMPVATETAVMPTPAPKLEGIAGLRATCEADGGCRLSSDKTQGLCRILEYSTQGGKVKIMGCEKSPNTYELYRQEAPANIAFTACLANGCVDQWGGWARITT